MAPTLLDGDIVLTLKARQKLKPGAIYVIDHSDLGLIIKRLSAARGKRFVFTGDNPDSTPSAVIAPVERARIKERAIFCFRKFMPFLLT